jgi:hypothetical protein
MTVAGRKKAGLWEMAEVAGAEAERIRSTQAALVKYGANKEVIASEIRRAEVFEDIERLIYTMMPVKAKVAEVMRPIAQAMATKNRFELMRSAAELEATKHPQDDTD